MPDMKKICEFFRDGDYLVVILPDGSEKRWLLDYPKEDVTISRIMFSFLNDGLIWSEWSYW